MIRLAAILIAGAIIFSPLQVLSSEGRVIDISGEECEEGLQPLSGSQFSVYVFCEDALGNYVGVIYSGKMSSPVDGAWSLSGRFWQGGKWSLDVTSYYYDHPSNMLYVATSEIYGEGGVFRLDLRNKEYVKLTAEMQPTGRSFKLESYSSEKQLLRYSISLNGKTINETEVPINQ